MYMRRERKSKKVEKSFRTALNPLKILTALFLLIGLVMVGCKKEELETSNSGKLRKSLYNETMIPCADSVTLSAFDNDESVIHYKVARYYAYWEIENALNEPLGIEGAEYRLTAYPVIIYDYDSKPKYYEFGVIVNGSVVSSITTIAKKESSNIISFIFEEPLNYDDYGNYSYFVGNYPSVFYGTPANPGDVPSALYMEDGITSIQDIPSCDILVNYANLIKSMDDTSRLEHANVINNMSSEIAEMNIGLADFWAVADERKDDILCMNDEQIIAEVQQDINQRSPTTRWDKYVIPSYNNYNLKKTFWRGWCGPSAIAWAYRGLYSNYPIGTTNYLRIHGDSPYGVFCVNYSYPYSYYDYSDDSNVYYNSYMTDNGLYYILFNYCIPGFGGRPMYINGMNKATKNVTNNNYAVNLTTQPHTRIRNYHLPVFNLIGCEWSFHYLVAFGSGYEKRSNGSIKNKFLLVTDNGTRASRNNYYPYWRSQSPDPGIRYKMYRNN